MKIDMGIRHVLATLREKSLKFCKSEKDFFLSSNVIQGNAFSIVINYSIRASLLR